MSNKISRKKEDYRITETGVFLHKRSYVLSPNTINSTGKNIFLEGVTIRADILCRGSLTTLFLGRSTFFEKNVTIRPPFKFYKREFIYSPIKIGDFVYIGENSIVNAISIGNNVNIGKNCVIGRNSIIKNCVKILDDTVIPPDAVISSFSIISGSPAKQVGELSDFTSSIFEKEAKERYNEFLATFEN
ncbi:dynactin subunit P25 [Neoconidiobolus thromboides FSU 785]|nr:dynactin subunit P25 [Neoconidiobolus thromboides FSU 785]